MSISLYCGLFDVASLLILFARSMEAQITRLQNAAMSRGIAPTSSVDLDSDESMMLSSKHIRARPADELPACASNSLRSRERSAEGEGGLAGQARRYRRMIFLRMARLPHGDVSV